MRLFKSKSEKETLSWDRWTTSSNSPIFYHRLSDLLIYSYIWTHWMLHRIDIWDSSIIDRTITALPSGIMDHQFDLDMALAPIHLRTAADIPGGVEVDTAERPLEIPTVDAFGDCAVCMDQFMPAERGKRVPCGHVFHEACLMTWLSLHQSCPLCRFQVTGSAITAARR